VNIYDIQTRSWSAGHLSEARDELAVTTVGHLAIFAGGSGLTTLSATVDVYDTEMGQWSTASLSDPGSNLSATSLGSLALFAGGVGGGDVVDVYDATTGQWSTTVLSEPRFALAATTAGPIAIFAGGHGPFIGGHTTGSRDVVDFYTIPEPSSLTFLLATAVALSAGATRRGTCSAG